MKTKYAVLMAVLVMCAVCRSSRISHTQTEIRFPYLWLGDQGFGGDIDKHDFPEPSGIIYHPSRGSLFVVSDEGAIEEIRLDGERLSLTRVPGDLEGLTIDPQTGLLYIVAEGEDVILEFDPDASEVVRKFPVNRGFQGHPNFLEKQTEEFDNGLESLAFVPDARHPHGGTFFAGNQWDPPMILELEVPLKAQSGEAQEAKIIRVLPVELDDPAAMFYNAERRVLCVVNDADNIYVEVTLDGVLVCAYAFPGDNQEGITWDAEGNIYIAQDTGGILKIKDLR